MVLFLSRSDRLGPLEYRWGTWLPQWWLWVQHTLWAAFRAYHLCCGPLWPLEPISVLLPSGTRAGCLPAYIVGPIDHAVVTWWPRLLRLGLLADNAPPPELPPDVVAEFYTDFHRPGAWTLLQALNQPPIARGGHPQARKGRCGECAQPWLSCSCVSIPPGYHRFVLLPWGPDSQGGWRCSLCGAIGPRAGLPAASRHRCPGPAVAGRVHGWFSEFLPPRSALRLLGSSSFSAGLVQARL